ncbi:hypothetical protein PMI06_002879 [Burkholderia sp. BT03]|nr:hypothetical protein PMI06_002879 [Burkholderia sp. BT03]
MSRCSGDWRDRYGPASMREHHLVPQAMMNDGNFTAQIKDVGIGNLEDYIHRQIAQMPNAQHIDVHESGSNKNRQPYFSLNLNGKITIAASNPSTPPINVSHARAVRNGIEWMPFTASVTISVNANAPHAMSYRSGSAIE